MALEKWLGKGSEKRNSYTPPKKKILYTPLTSKNVEDRFHCHLLWPLIFIPKNKILQNSKKKFDLFNHFLSQDCIQKFITFSGAYTDCRAYFQINFAWQILECFVDNKKKTYSYMCMIHDKKGANFYFKKNIITLPSNPSISPANHYSFQY